MTCRFIKPNTTAHTHTHKHYYSSATSNICDLKVIFAIYDKAVFTLIPDYLVINISNYPPKAYVSKFCLGKMILPKCF